jgi:hypothetical protein
MAPSKKKKQVTIVKIEGEKSIHPKPPKVRRNPPRRHKKGVAFVDLSVSV